MVSVTNIVWKIFYIWEYELTNIITFSLARMLSLHAMFGFCSMHDVVCMHARLIFFCYWSRFFCTIAIM